MKIIGTGASHIKIGLGDAPINLGNSSSPDIWNTLVTVHTESGLEGSGIISTQTARRDLVLPKSAHELQEFFVPENFLPSDDLLSFYDRLREMPMQPETRSGVLTAIADALGLEVQKPAYTLFPEIQKRACNVCVTLTINSLEATLADLDAVLKLCPDIKILKLKEGTQQDDAKMKAIIAELDKRVPHRVKFIFDFNGAYSQGDSLDVDGAINHIERLIKICSEERILFIEEPINCYPHSIHQIEGFKKIERHFANRSWDFFFDESITSLQDIDSLIAAQVPFEGINLKLPKSGGFFGVIELAKHAASHGKKFGLGCMFELGPGIAAALSVIYALQNIGTLVVADVDGDMKPDEALKGSLYSLPPYIHGTRSPAERNGLGVVRDELLMTRGLQTGHITVENIEI